MASIINSDNGVVSGSMGLKQSADTSGNLVLQSNGNTVISIDTSLNANFAGTVSAVGNVTGGNIRTAGLISATGTITSSANITGGNILTAGIISSTGNLTLANITPTSANLTIVGNVYPSANATYDLGASTLRWKTVYTTDLELNNGIGDYTIVEGADDLFIYNNRSGKVFKFALIEVDPATAPPKAKR